MITALAFVLASLAEIAGCFGFWQWARQGRSAIRLLPSLVSLILFALLLTRIDSASAGRAFAAYGGIYITAALVWMWAVEGMRPDRWGLAGVALCLVGCAVILLGRHG